MLVLSRVKFCIFVGLNVGGSVGWALCENFGIMTAFIASGVGSLVGIYLAWEFARRHLG